ncbi:hypothetical protein CMUS01_00939 [Colletotrichum musicola]|uniref:Ecp2 effector protein-like domain-containing protein n=1 Tax=Colletotrichum musicola TaxID=2175873 RepID=A0A8H6NXX5_9PEZI|nr:hypothetical protein CMUS01_00939 [Colletotrichum musicola]
MAIVNRLLAAAIAGPVIQDRDIAGSSCGTVCNVAAPCDGAVCVEGKRDDGSCYAAWLNAGIGQLSIDGVAVNSTTHDPYKFLKRTQPIHVRDDNDNDQLLSKRLEFGRSNQDQRACEYATRTCHDRGRGASFSDCRELLRVAKHIDSMGLWSIVKENLAGRHWLNLMEAGNCIFAVGHPNAQAAEGTTHIGNFDIWHALSGVLDDCNKKGRRVEAQGTSLCSKWPLEYWITDKNRFSCCDASLGTYYLDFDVEGEKLGSGP